MTEYSFLFSAVLENYQERHGRGDPYALLSAIDDCGQRGLPMPRWASEALHEKMRAVHESEAFSWDEIFGSIAPKPGKHRKKLHSKAKYIHRVYSRLVELHSNGRGVDNILFEDVAEEFGIGAKLCKELYYEMKRIIAEPDENSPW